MKLELGKIKINDIQFSDKTYVENHILHVNKEEVEKLVLEDDKLIGCNLEIAKPGEKTRITPVKDVIEGIFEEAQKVLEETKIEF